MGDKDWKSAITDVSPGKIRIRGYDIDEIMEKLSYAEAVFLVLKGRLPSRAEAEMVRAILVSSLDHGVTAPSILSARNIIAAGNPLNAAVAAGILAIGDAHGGAIEEAARIFQLWSKKKGDPDYLAGQLVEDLKSEKKRMPGFGHLLHKTDPRTIKLFEIAERCGFWGRHVNLCLAVEKVLRKSSGKKLPINIDGAIAAVISDMEFDWRLGKGFFILSRVPGLIAHAYEEMTREKPLHQLGRSDCQYDGPSHKKI
ncbi:Citrate synthase [Candidatus Zixiibacteriota bacterium]|nr:Citrate synthase [candidate division Zixibacteria bacterium]